MSRSTETDFVVNADPDVETLIIDHAFRLRHRSMGEFTHRLPPGLYKFKYKRGPAISEELVEIPAGSGKPLIITPRLELPFTSSMPLRKTRGASDEHLVTAKRLSEAPPLQCGAGSRIFIFIRLDPDAAGTRADVSEGLTLHATDGALIVDLPTVVMRDKASGAPCAGINVSVDPGTYRLRHRHRDETLEMAIVASPHWQTQVFLIYKATESDAVEPTPLVSASVMMSRTSFNPDDELLRLADASLVALREKRPILSKRQIDALLSDKYENPMLGIYGAHALVGIEHSSNLAHVVGNLESLVHGHPDVMALRLSLSTPIVVDTPPMLRSSWRAILEASLAGRAVIPPGSLASRIPAALLEGTPWMIWAPEDLLDPKLTAPHDITMDLQEIAAAVARTQYQSESSITESLTQDEEDLFAFLSRRSRLQEQTRKARSSDPKPFDEITLAHKFGTTITRIQATVSGLAAKLREPKP